MSQLPWWLNLVMKILSIDVLIAFLVAAWSWIAGDFSAVAPSNRFFASGVIMILISLASGLGSWAVGGPTWQNGARGWRQISSRPTLLHG
ncbi:MAG TPA: hypothetical protein VHO49_17915 [Anaerolineales bacterium]|nr:hypothetical protein [Anaerolineales bacterium]